MRYKTFIRISLLCLVSLLATGCAGLKSSQINDPDRLSGVAYYMPLRAFVLTVTKSGGNVTELNWDVSPAIPDLRNTYSLKFNPHWIGKTTIDVAVGPSGLLGAANTTTTSSVAEIVKLETAAFATKARRLQVIDTCPSDGTFVFYFLERTDPNVPNKVCGNIDYTIEPVPLIGGILPMAGSTSSPAHMSSSDSAQGVFYRMNRPFIASAVAPTRLFTRLLSVPNESPTMYLPFGRTLFAANDAKVTFDDGILKRYQQSDEGELLATLQFPAKILSAYFTAVGNIFAAFGDKDAETAKLELEQFKLRSFADKLAKCTAALAINDEKEQAAALASLSCDSMSFGP